MGGKSVSKKSTKTDAVVTEEAVVDSLKVGKKSGKKTREAAPVTATEIVANGKKRKEVENEIEARCDDVATGKAGKKRKGKKEEAMSEAQLLSSVEEAQILPTEDVAGKKMAQGKDAEVNEGAEVGGKKGGKKGAKKASGSPLALV